MAEKRIETANDVVLFDDAQPLRKTRGKFSAVYRGRSLKTDGEVLVKRLHGLSDVADPSLRKYERLTQLRHPALQRVSGVAQKEGGVYVVMQYREGEDLKAFLARRGRFRDSVQVLRIILDLLDGLAYLHHHHFIHTDIKPANILLYEGRRGEMRGRLLDPGEVLWLEEPLPSRKPFSMIYSPPEQVLGFPDLICPASDIYTLGVVMWEMMTGSKPFHAFHPAAILNLQVNTMLEKKRSIPQEVYHILSRASAKEPMPKPPRYYSSEELRALLLRGIRKRYPAAAEMAEEIRHYL
jgi:serine/threonine-protein kinase